MVCVERSVACQIILLLGEVMCQIHMPICRIDWPCAWGNLAMNIINVMLHYITLTLLHVLVVGVVDWSVVTVWLTCMCSAWLS